MATGGNNYDNNRNQRGDRAGERGNIGGLNGRCWATVTLGLGALALAASAIYKPDPGSEGTNEFLFYTGILSGGLGALSHATFRILDYIRRP